MHLLDTTRTAYFFDFRAVSYIFVVCSNGVGQIFRADEFWADDPSPINLKIEWATINKTVIVKNYNSSNFYSWILDIQTTHDCVVYVVWWICSPSLKGKGMQNRINTFFHLLDFTQKFLSLAHTHTPSHTHTAHTHTHTHTHGAYYSLLNGECQMFK